MLLYLTIRTNVKLHIGMGRIRKWTFLGIGVFVVIVVYTIAFVNPVIVDYSQAKIEAMTVKATNRAVNSVVSTNTYRELLTIKYDAAGKIQSLTTNTLQMNNLSSDIALLTQSELELLANMGIAVPLGTFSGWPLLTGIGPDVNLRVVPVGSVNCAFTSEFIGAGFNQTRHRIVLKVRSVVQLVMPLTSRRIEAEIEVLLAESIIVGEVPEFLFTK